MKRYQTNTSLLPWGFFVNCHGFKPRMQIARRQSGGELQKKKGKKNEGINKVEVPHRQWHNTEEG